KVVNEPSIWLPNFIRQVLAKASSRNWEINSIIALYLSCSYLNEAKVGRDNAQITVGDYNKLRSYLLDLAQKTDFTRYNTVYGDQQAEIVAAILWDVRAVMDHRMADRRAVSAWAEFIRSAAPDHPQENWAIVEFMRIFRRQFDVGDMKQFGSQV